MKYDVWAKSKALDEAEQIIPGTSGKFHDLERVHQATKDWDVPPYLIFIAGARGVGKTVTLLDLMMDAYQEGRQTIWTRNFESTFLKPTFYKGFLNMGKRLCGVPQEFTARPEGVYTDERGGELICMFKSINMGTELKGNEYKQVKYLLCDEFMVLPTERYPSGAPEKLGVMLDSMRTYADGCILCSNFTYMTNPYWASLRVYPKSNEGVTGFKDKATAIEVCERGYYNQSRFKPDDPRAIAINTLQGGNDHAAYDEDPNFELIKKVPVQFLKKMNFEITTLALNIHFYQNNTGEVYATPGKRGKTEERFVTKPKLLDKTNFMLPEYMIKWLKELINGGGIRFSDANTLYEVMSIIYKL
jgi:hypothetical protein